MMFSKRRISEEEQRVYNVEYFFEYGGYYGEDVMTFTRGIVNDENDIWLLSFGALGDPLNPNEADYYGFIFDYKGEVFYMNLKWDISMGENPTITWYELDIDKTLNEQQMQSLREAFMVMDKDCKAIFKF